MNNIETLDQVHHFKVFGDQRRIRILQILMAAPATLSQLGELLGLHPAKVRYHLLQLQQVGLVQLESTKQVRGFVEKYYQASARAYRVQRMIIPEISESPPLLITGSHDLALDLLATSLQQSNHKLDIFTLPIGSLDGLIALRQGFGQVAGIHLFDPPSGEYNLPFIRHLLPDKSVNIYTLAHRQQGLIVEKGNPLKIKGLSSLAQPGVRFINRRPGSGTRLWLDHQFKEQHIAPDQISGHDTEVNTHIEVAQAVARGDADAGLGLEAAARTFDLGFVPLFEERFDLAVLEERVPNALLTPVLDFLQTSRFRKAVESLGGYNTQQMGIQLAT